MSEITALHYERNLLHVTLYESDTEQSRDVTIADIELVNLLAVDGAFERRCPVELQIDDHRRLERVFCTARAPIPDSPDPPREGVAITRISTQRQDTLVAEVNFMKDPTDEFEDETQSRTSDPLLHSLCHGAYVANRRVRISVDDDGRITAVAK
jgi:hypothetical protein